ncbi:hypothetical protein GTQ40_09775 [Flavobacteriaceae bacterium R38]|nr:hypothetical protein [Flavobacteriaceae bacterium R38]
MIHFRTEIRNSPKEQTLKIYLTNVGLNDEVKKKLEGFDEIKLIEIRETMGRNRVSENITVFRKEGIDINVLKTKIDDHLERYFE